MQIVEHTSGDFFSMCEYCNDLLSAWHRDEHRSSRRTELTRSRAIAVVKFDARLEIIHQTVPNHDDIITTSTGDVRQYNHSIFATNAPTYKRE